MTVQMRSTLRFRSNIEVSVGDEVFGRDALGSVVIGFDSRC